MSRGKFITFEGGEGVGKSTQIQKLSTYLRGRDVPHILTREPGGTILAEKIRTLVVQKSDTGPDLDTLTEFLLFSAARRDHVQNLIKPALAKGQWVLCDRFFDSSYVYQIVLGEVSQNLFQEVTDQVCAGLVPDITFVLDMDPLLGLKRAQRQENLENRFESRGIKFHQKVRDQFLKLAQQNKDRMQVVDAFGEPEQIFDRLHAYLETMI